MNLNDTLQNLATQEDDCVRLEQFEQFQTLARLKHFRQAAEACQLSTSALTRSIQTIEQDLGVVLFKRSTRSVSLTAAGQVFLQYCETVLNQHQQLCVDLKPFKRSSVQQKIVLGYSPEFAQIALDACGQFMENRPFLTLELNQQDAEELQQQFAEGHVDIAIGHWHCGNSEQQLAELFNKLQFFAVDGHPLAQSAHHIDALQKFPLLACLADNKADQQAIHQLAQQLNKLSSMKLGSVEQLLPFLKDKLHVGVMSKSQFALLSEQYSLAPVTLVLGNTLPKRQIRIQQEDPLLQQLKRQLEQSLHHQELSSYSLAN